MNCKILFSGREVEFIFGDAWDKSLVEGDLIFLGGGGEEQIFSGYAGNYPPTFPPPH